MSKWVINKIEIATGYQLLRVDGDQVKQYIISPYKAEVKDFLEAEKKPEDEIINTTGETI